MRGTKGRCTCAVGAGGDPPLSPLPVHAVHRASVPVVAVPRPAGGLEVVGGDVGSDDGRNKEMSCFQSGKR